MFLCMASQMILCKSGAVVLTVIAIGAGLMYRATNQPLDISILGMISVFYLSLMGMMTMMQAQRMAADGVLTDYLSLLVATHKVPKWLINTFGTVRKD